MEHNNEYENSNSNLITFGAKETEVARILLELDEIISQTWSIKFPSWGSKGRRSVPGSGGGGGSTTPLLPPPPPPPSRADVERASDNGPHKPDASSPTTPLSFSPSESDGKSKLPKSKRTFSPSESDGKSKRPKTKHSKMNKEELKQLERSLLEQREALKREVENVTRYRDTIKALNGKLKAKKEELILRVRNEEYCPVEVNTSLTLVSQPESHHQLIVHQTAVEADKTEIVQIPYVQTSSTWPSTVGSSMENMHVGPGIVPDLNLSADEALLHERYWRMAMAAKARHKRIELNRAKNSSNANKPRQLMR